MKLLSPVQLFATPWTVAPQAPRSVGFSRHDSGVDCHSFSSSQNKGLSKYRRRSSMLQAGPSSSQRQRGNQSRKARGNLCPRDGILHQTVSRLPVANQVFLGSWTVGICQEGCSLRSAPQRRHIAQLRQRSTSTPGKLNSWDWGGN